MQNAGITILVVIILGAISFLAMYYFTDFGVKKSLVIAGSAAVAMIIFDVVILKLIKKNR